MRTIPTYMPRKAQKVLGFPSRYKVLYGGRGSAKSHSIARSLVTRSLQSSIRVLCTREMQNSIKDSVHRLLTDIIDELKLGAFFTIQKDSITNLMGSEFIFKGLRHNISEIKSLEGIDICWVEEAEKVPEDSWMILIPTIRKKGSEIWISFNPDDEKSATYTRFVAKEGKLVELPDCRRAEMTFRDNDLFPEVLRREFEWDLKNDPEKYEHVWEGKPKRYSNAVIFRNKIRVEEFEAPEGVQFKFGADFGYAEDPTALVRMFIHEKKLYIDYEAYGIGVELDELHAFFESVPDSHNWSITADSARPETISHLSRPTKDGLHDGFMIDGSEKGKGSVEDGITFLKSFEAIVIHPRCTGSIDNFNNYRWKTDRITNEILPIPLDKSNHIPDACRYGLESWMKGGVTIFDVL